MEWILLMEGQASSTHWLLHQTRQNKSICLNNSLKRNSTPKMALSSPMLWYPFLAMIMASTLLEVEVLRWVPYYMHGLPLVLSKSNQVQWFSQWLVIFWMVYIFPIVELTSNVHFRVCQPSLYLLLSSLAWIDNVFMIWECWK